MNIFLAKINKKNKYVKIFLTLFLFVFLFTFLFGANPNFSQAADTANSVTTVPANAQEVSSQAQNDTCSKSWLTSPLICLSVSVFVILTDFVSLSVSLFQWAIDPVRISVIINNGSIYEAWKTVRDFLNITFILFLLFSAFCTIFQIQKYSYKNILLNLVLMALLVNFSFPIARFIIDVSNVLSYTLISAFFDQGTANLPGAFANITNIANLVYPGNSNLTPLIFADIFLFIFGVTFLVLALLFIIRIIALAILIIFSPVAFTGSIIPGLQDKASSWWTQLFNYAFFAPIMLFMLHLATKLSINMSDEMETTLSSIVSKNAQDGNWLTQACIFVIPIIILWIGMGIAKGMSIAGAGAITDFAQNKIKGMGMWLGKAPWKGVKKVGTGIKRGVGATGISGGTKQWWDQTRFSKKSRDAKRSSREAGWADKFGVRGAIEEDMKKRSEEYKKNNLSVSELKAKSLKGDLAAAHRLAQDGEIDANSYSAAIGKLDPIKHKSIIDGLNHKIMEKQADVIIEHKRRMPGANASAVYEEVLGDLSPEALAKQTGLHNNINSDTHLQDYVRNKVIDPAHPDYHKEFFKKLTKKQRDSYIGLTIHP